MAVGFSKSTVTLAAATTVRLSALLATEGYTGSMIGAYLNIHPGALTDVFYGTDSTVDATTGIPITTTRPFEERRAPPAIDPGAIWLFSTGGGDISVAFQPV